MKTNTLGAKYKRGALTAALVCVLIALPVFGSSCAPAEVPPPPPGITYDLCEGAEITSIALYFSSKRFERENLCVDVAVKNNLTREIVYNIEVKVDDAAPMGYIIPRKLGKPGIQPGETAEVWVITAQPTVMPSRLAIRIEEFK